MRLLSALLFCCFLQPSVAGVTYFHTDRLGTPILATDESGGVIWSKRYSAYGLQSPPAIDTEQSFTGHERDAETGLTYMQGRFYDPSIGRFLSMDPAPVRAEEPATFNRYAYANNNPLSYIDPDGRDSYLVSRPLEGPVGLLDHRHNFVVTHANYPGDRNGSVLSWGKNNSGNTGRVDNTTRGRSQNTSTADQEFWDTLQGSSKARTHVSKIPASDDWVKLHADILLEDTEYSALSLGDKTNSNSAASAVANSSAGKDVPIPDGYDGDKSIGADSAEHINFQDLGLWWFEMQ